MSKFAFLDWRVRCVAGFAATLLSATVFGAVLLLFGEDGNTPWFPADSPLAAAAASCPKNGAGHERRRCLVAIKDATASEASTHKVASTR